MSFQIEETHTLDYQSARFLVNESGYELIQIVMPKLGIHIPMSIYVQDKLSRCSDSIYLPANWFSVC